MTLRVLSDFDDVLGNLLAALQRIALIERKCQNSLCHNWSLPGYWAERSALLDVLDRLEHFRNERGSRTNERRASRARTNANRRVVRTEAAGVERIVVELVSVAFATTASALSRSGAGRRSVLSENTWCNG